MDDEKVTTQATVQKFSVVNKNERIYDWNKATDASELLKASLIAANASGKISSKVSPFFNLSLNSGVLA